MLEELKWAIVWRLSPLLERMGLVVISCQRWGGLCQMEGDYPFLKHQLQRAEAKLEEMGVEV